MTCARCGKETEPLTVGSVALDLPYCEDCSTLLAAAADQEERERASRDALTRAGGHGRLLEWSLDSYPDDSAGAAAAARDWLERFHRGERANLWLHGPAGTRKTGLAWSIIRSLAETAVSDFYDAPEEQRPSHVPTPARFVVWPDLLNELKGQYRDERRDSDHDPSRLLERAGKVPVLALDELGGERPTPYALEQLAALVDRRYLDRLPMIVTSNYGTQALTARLAVEDEFAARRIIGRIVDGAVGFEFTGPSRRRPG